MAEERAEKEEVRKENKERGKENRGRRRMDEECNNSGNRENGN